MYFIIPGVYEVTFGGYNPWGAIWSKKKKLKKRNLTTGNVEISEI